MNVFVKASLVTLVVCAAQAQVQASMVRLDGNGFDVIYDDSSFGYFMEKPTLIGDTLVFAPSHFVSDSRTSPIAPGGEWQFATEITTFKVMADPGKVLQQASFVERGDYRLVDGQAYLSQQTDVSSLSDPSKNVTWKYYRGVSAYGSPKSGSWSISAYQPLYGIGGAEFRFKNSLETNGCCDTQGGVASLNYLGVTITAVPEPSTYAMLLAGLGMIGLTLRRRRV